VNHRFSACFREKIKIKWPFCQLADCNAVVHTLFKKHQQVNNREKGIMFNQTLTITKTYAERVSSNAEF
jgi:hypothetical protein